MSLKESLGKWQDWDGAAYELGVAIGLFSSKDRFQTNTKHVFWTNNPVGNALHDCLEKLVEGKILGKRDPDDAADGDIQYRWSPTFKGSWEEL